MSVLAKYLGGARAAEFARGNAMSSGGMGNPIATMAGVQPTGKIGGAMGAYAPGDFDWTKHRTQGGLREDAISGLDDGFEGSLASLISSAPPEIRDGLQVFSGYRSIERQQELWDASDKSGKMVARPGKSNHNHGKASDLMWNGQRLDKAPAHIREWVHANAPSHGLQFPMSWEPWHIEPINALSAAARS